jgi:hypothetical protein
MDELVTLVRDPDRLPPVTDPEAHEIIGIAVCDNIGNADPLDDRFVISFSCSSGKTLRIRLPADRLLELADVLRQMARERDWREGLPTCPWD